ncbi:hypothetical protein PMIN03_006081 [Paraphaeosphaeria minitans]
MPSTNCLTVDIPPALRRQLSAIPPAHLDEIISLALEATVDPSIDFLAAVKALWRCNAHNPRSYGTMEDATPDADLEATARERQTEAQQDSQRHHREQSTLYTYEPDAPSPTPSPPSLPSQSPPKAPTPFPSLSTSKAKPTATFTLQPSRHKHTPPPQHNHHHQRHFHNRTLILSLLRDRTHPSSNMVNISWQRREQLALAQAYLQAFDLWPHARSSEKRCEGFLARYVNL